MKKNKDYPEEGEYVICKVESLNPNSAFVSIDDYDKKGMIHVSEIASTWVRDIRKFVKVGQKTVVKVTGVDRSKNLVYLSLKRVKASVKREKITEYKNEKKAENLLKFVAKELKISQDSAYKKIGFVFQDKFGLMYSGFELAAFEGKDALIKEGIDKKWASAIEKIAKKNIKPKEVSIKAVFKIISNEGDGIEIIKKAISIKEDGVEIKYISAPEYSIKVKGKDFPFCEKLLENTKQKITESIGKKGEVELVRE